MHTRWRRHGLGRTWYTALLAASLGLSACHDPDQADDVLSRYAGRVANVLEMDVETPAFDWTQLALPPRRARISPVPDLRIGVIDALDLVHCDLLHQVGQRNSSLGRMQRPSQRLHHEITLLAGLRRCLRDPEKISTTDSDFRQWLREIIAKKERALPAVFWNTLYADAELERVFSLAGGATHISRLDQVTASTQTLRELRGLLATAYTQTVLDPEALEDELGNLQATAAGATVLAQMYVATHWLNRLTSTMNRGEPRRMCPQGRPTRRARILDNVFRTFYIGEVQPWLATLNREALAWLQAFHALSGTLPGAPPDGLLTFLRETTSLEHPAGIWAQYRRAVPAHARAWQRWLAACNLMPGQ